MSAAFKDNDAEAPLRLEELEREYCRITGQPYPIPEMVFARSWMLFRVRGAPGLSYQTISLY